MVDNGKKWYVEERNVFPEMGTRLTQFIMRDYSGHSIIAVVGIERTQRHMLYTVTQDFLRVLRSTTTSNVPTKWKGKREVVKWLKLLCSVERPPIFTHPSQKLSEAEPSEEYVTSLLTRFSKRLSPPAGEGCSTFQPRNSGIVWSGDASICSKQLKHYPAFCRSGTNIPVDTFVFFITKVGTGDLGYVEDLYEDMKGNKLVRVRQFHLREEMLKRIPNLDAKPNEVFITSDKKVISVESIDGIATILSPNHFEKCLKVLPRSLSFGIFMCHRQYIKMQIKPFRLSQLRGYTTQPILPSLSPPEKEEYNPAGKGKGFTPRKPSVRHFKAPKSSKGGLMGVASDNQVVADEPNHEPLKIKLPRGHSSFNVNDNIEVLSQDSGLRGCWFRCKILHCSKKFFKVQLCDVLDVDGHAKLEEEVPSTRVAKPDVLGMRCAGRLTVRPWPYEALSDDTFEVGAAVDLWWCDGWWEGVVIGNQTSERSKFQVYLAGEKMSLAVERKNLRASKDWVDNKWIDIKAKPDILSFLSSISNPTPKLTPVTIDAKASTSSTLRLDGCSSKSADLKAQEEMNLKKRWLIRNNEDEAGRGKMLKK